ncbi:MAG TPA: hypothetical protein VF629_17755 [Hymenobacter sp.]|uniref:hypothetical protein n=1 Tax=Hymenobacter sp. TaxID=1898978 RepID=UPI002ED804ED
MKFRPEFARPSGPLGDVAFVTYLYYREARHLIPTPADFAAWLASLPGAARGRMAARGLAAARTSQAFNRFLLEKRGHSFTDFMAARLKPSVLAFWQALPDEDS